MSWKNTIFFEGGGYFFTPQFFTKQKKFWLFVYRVDLFNISILY